MRRRGVTLVEVLISTLILSSVIGGTFAAFLATRRFSVRSQRRLEALNFARRYCDNLRQFVTADMDTNAGNPFRQVGAGNAWQTWSAWRTLDGQFGAAPFNGQIRYRVDPVTIGATNYQFRQVTVEVRWDEPAG